MKISELIKKTGVSKETIHHYIREGIIRKPKKTGKNTADYSEIYIRQIRLIKELRDNYFLPLPIIKKILKEQKKHTPTEQTSFQLQSEYFRPIERFFPREIVGKKAFQKATGMAVYWINKMEEWGIISSSILKDGQPVYSHENVIIGKLIVDMDRLGFGVTDGYDPKDIKPVSDAIRNLTMLGTPEQFGPNAAKRNSQEFKEKYLQYFEIMSLFLYHFYRKSAKEALLTKDDDVNNID